MKSKMHYCKTCNTPFDTKRGIYCSNACRPSFYDNKIGIKLYKCKNCNKEIKGSNIKGKSIHLCPDCIDLTIDCFCGCGGKVSLLRHKVYGTKFISGHGMRLKEYSSKVIQPLSKEEILKRVHLKNPDISIISDFKDTLCKVILHSSKCDHTWQSTVKSAIHGNGCPICKFSMGENIILNFLTNRDISFIRQKTFKDCIGELRPLKFDFYLPEFNMCIEYDGQQHYESVSYWGGEEALEKRKNYDVIKTNYCKNNNILLLRIPYWAKEDIEYSLLIITTMFRIKKFPSKFLPKLEQIFKQLKEEFKDEQIYATL